MKCSYCPGDTNYLLIHKAQVNTYIPICVSCRYELFDNHTPGTIYFLQEVEKEK